MNRFAVGSATSSILFVCVLIGAMPISASAAQPDETVAIGQVTGKVLMPDGSPAVGAQVRVIGFRIAEGFPITYEILWTLETSAGDDGSFRVQPEPIAKEKLSGETGLMFTIVVTHETAGFTGTTDVRRADNISDPIDTGSLRLREPATLSGSVTDAGGTPLADATVILMGWITDGQGRGVQVLPEASPFRTGTRADGAFTFERVPNEGQFVLFIRKEGHPEVFLMPARDGVSVALPRPGSLAGRVVTAEGTPVADCQVWYAPQVAQPQQGQPGPWMMPKAVVTDGDGHFALATLFPGACDVRVEPPASAQDRWAPAVVTNKVVSSGQTTDLGDVVLTSGGTIVGKVVDGETGKPLADVSVSVNTAEARSMVARWQTNTDAEGRYDIRVPVAAYQVRARLQGYAQRGAEPWQPKDVSVEDGARVECDFQLHPLFVVEGRLLLPDGSPAGNCTIRGTTSANPYLHARTDGTGRFRLERVSPGEKVDITASDPEHGARLSTSFTVSEEKTELTFTMKETPTCIVTGRVVDDDGNPVSGVRVSISEFAGNISYHAGSGSTDADGRFRIQALKGGDAYISLGDRGGSITDDHRLELSSDTIEKGDLLFPRLESELAGVVVDIDGRPVAGAQVNARGVAKQGYANAQTGKDGKFHLTKLPNDTIQVEAYLVEPETRIVRHQVREKVPAGTTDVRLVMGIRQKEKEAVSLSPGDQAPELVLEEDGPRVSLASLKGRPVVVAFVSIYSRPCANALLELKALQEETGADRLAIVAVHDRTATPEEIEGFRKDHGISFPILRVPQAGRDGWDSNTFHAYGVKALPTTFLIDYNGKVAAQGTLSSLAEKLTQLPD